MRLFQLPVIVLVTVFHVASASTTTAADKKIGIPGFRTHTLNIDSTYSACAVLDVNGDGKLDVFCGGWWYEAPTWKKHFARDVEVIRGRYDDYSNLPLDVNGDGRLDLISANYRSQKLYWFEHPAKPTDVWKTHLIAQPGPMETARLVDVDQDGHIDLLPNGVRFAAWWELKVDNSKGIQWLRHELPKEVAGHGVGFGDIDGDGRNDVVGSRGWLKAPKDRRNGRWYWKPEFELHRDCALPILIFDIDGDKDNDILWARGHKTGLYWLEQVRSDNSADQRAWRLHAIDTSWSQAHSLLVGDLNNEGQPELIAGKRYMGHDGKDLGEYDPMLIYAYSFDAVRRTWQRKLISAGWNAGFGLDPKLADLDGDGDLDIVGAGRSGLFWFENQLISKGNAPKPTNPKLPTQSYQDHTQLMTFKDESGVSHEVKNYKGWGRRRAHILASLQSVLGPIPNPSRRVPLDVQTNKEFQTERYLVKRITYAAEPGDRVPAYLLIPKDIKSRVAAMLCLHQTQRSGKAEPVGLSGKPSMHYAHELANRGYVCLVPDYPSFGEYKFDFQAARQNYQSGSMKAVWNNIRAVDLLEALPYVDSDRIGCIGHSLGGHNALFTAALDQRIKAVICSCGFTGFRFDDMPSWTSDRYMPLIRTQYGNDPQKVPFDFHEVVAAIAPRAVFVNAPLHDSDFKVAGVREVVQKAEAVYALIGAKNKITTVHPDAPHSFPDTVRQQAYEWLKTQLR